jgi:hypothetical protein
MSATRNLAQSFILSGVQQGRSANWIQDLLQGKGLGYRRAEILKDVKWWEATWQRGQRLASSWKTEVLNPDLYMKTGWQLKTRFETVVSVHLRDRFTGEVEERNVTVTHSHEEDGVTVSDRDQRFTRAELETAAEELVAGYPLEDRFEIIGAVPVLGFANMDIE